MLDFHCQEKLDTLLSYQYKFVRIFVFITPNIIPIRFPLYIPRNPYFPNCVRQSLYPLN